MIQLLMSDDYFKMYEIVEVAHMKATGIVIAKDTFAGPFSTTYTIKKLKISKWWLIRKIQIWSIKKAFA